MIRTLGPGDEAALEAFAAAHAAHTMFLRHDLQLAGIVDTGAQFSGTYVAAYSGDAIVAVAAHYWNGNIIVAGPPAECAQAALAAATATGRTVQGLLGAWDAVVVAEKALGLADAPATLRSREDLYRLELAQLRVPAPLRDGTWTCRPPLAHELPLLSGWRSAYHVEALNAPPGPDLDDMTRSEVDELARGDLWVLACADRPVAMTAFNARLPDMVQVGGVYTPPSLRGRGYARAAVAGSLLVARSGGAATAILFTGDDNASASAAYLSLGFEIVGDYALVLYA